MAASHLAGGDLSLEAQGGYFSLNASRSAAALFGSRGGAILGAGVRAGLGKNLFARLSASHIGRSGERVFVADEHSPVFPLGHPLALRLVPVYLDLALRVSPEARLHPYAGIGAGAVLFHEESTVAGDTQTENRTRPSGRVLAGIVWGVGAVKLGGEVGYSRTPDAIGVGGVSKVYGENDVGGLSVMATLIFKR
jgi:hypothetical protein